MYKNKNGITIVSLVITIVILLMLVSVTVYTGTGVIKQAHLQTVNTNMMLIQAKAKTIAEQAKFNKDEEGNINTDIYKGTNIADTEKISQIVSNKVNGKISKLVNDNIIEDASKWYLLSKEDLSSMGLEKIDIEEGYIVNYETEEIIYVKGFNTNGTDYYKLSDMKNLTIKE